MGREDGINKEIEKEYIKYLISNKYGIAISFLRAYIDGQFSSEASYHLHFFFSYDKEVDKLFILCLDDGGSFSIDQYSKLDNEDRDKEVDKALIMLSTFFINQIYRNMTIKKPKRHYLFFRQNQKLWNSFNRMKEDFLLDAIENVSSLRRGVEPVPVSVDNSMNKIKYDLSIEDKSIRRKVS